jgi:TusA-related sulfurtransferase
MNKGDILVVKSTDPLAEYDFPDYCESTGHQLLKMDCLSTYINVHIKKM